ncbi:MAG: exo-alpha-sialidase [Planctomycetes bacterium]|nr:exo-alpha-sialidase [Planctomycetota bacterium]
MMRRFLWVLIATIGCSGPEARPETEAILLGTAVRTISPPPGIPLVGYPSGRPNTGVALDLCARVAVFGMPGKSEPAAALVVLDFIHIDLELGRTIRERASAALPGLAPASIMVSGTHTHSGPSRLDEAGLSAAVDAVAAAWKSREAVVARIGHARARWGHNRRVVDLEGKAKNDWKDPDGLHSGPFNPDLPFVAFDDARSGELRALLVNYGCHPVVCGPGNTKVSADYPGYLVRSLEASTKAKTAIFITGAAGDINPRDPLHPDPEKARTMGEALAAEVRAALPRARPLKTLPITVVSAPLRTVVRPEWEKRFAERLEASPEGSRIVSEVQALRIGDLAFLSVPGEIVTELGLAIQNSSPFAETLIVYNANDHLGYLISDRIRREGGHEANSAASPEIEKPLLAAAREALGRAAGRESSASGPQKVDLYAEGDNGFHSYRIPSLIVTPKGTILAFAEARKADKSDFGHIETVLRRSADGGTSWSPIQVVASDGENAVQNPTAVVDRSNGTVWLMLMRIDGAKYRNEKDLVASAARSRSVWVTRSRDDGATWEKPRDITESVCRPDWRDCIPGPGVGIQMRSGRLVIPACHFQVGASMDDAVNAPMISDDHGGTWKLGGDTDPKMDESHVVELTDGSLLLNMRSNRGLGRRGTAISRDGGLSWSKVTDDPTLVEPVCEGCLIRYSDANLLFSNPANEKRGRSRLTVRASYDEGRTWPVAKLLHAGPSAYSCLAVLPDRSIGCLYEHGVKSPAATITFARFPFEWLLEH